MAPTSNRPRMLTPSELDDLRREMVASSAWMKRELARRREGRNKAPDALPSDAVNGLIAVVAAQDVGADVPLGKIQGIGLHVSDGA